MAEITVSQVASPVKAHNLIHIEFLNDETPVVSSLDVARNFQRRHSHILRDIDRLRSILPKSFCEPNFGLTFNEVPGPHGGVRREKAYHLTRDAFSLLVMGMTGKAAIMWKLRYIEAFNALEAAIRENIRTDALAESSLVRRETARLLWTLGPAQKRRLRRAVRYRDMGLSQREIGRLLEIPRRSVQELLKAADVMGYLPYSPTRPVQGSLLEVGA